MRPAAGLSYLICISMGNKKKEFLQSMKTPGKADYGTTQACHSSLSLIHVVPLTQLDFVTVTFPAFDSPRLAEASD